MRLRVLSWMSVLVVLAVIAGCAGRKPVHRPGAPEGATSSGVSGSEAQETSRDAATRDRQPTGAGGERAPASPAAAGGETSTATMTSATNDLPPRPGGEAEPPAAPSGTAPVSPGASAGPPAGADSAGPADPAASVYVFSPQQAVSTRSSSAPSSAASGRPTPSSVPDAPQPRSAESPGDEPAADPAQAPAPPERRGGTSDEARGALQLAVVATAPETTVGATVTVDVIASSSGAIVDAPLHLSFDPTVLEFAGGTPGDFLTQGGSSVVFLVDGRSRPGDVAVAVGRVERGQGATGEGTLCRVRFRALGPGESSLLVGQAMAWDASGREVPVLASGTSIVVK